MSRSKLATLTTGFFALAMLPGAVMNILQPAVAVDMAAQLGIPLLLLTLVGIWKLLGVTALLVPGFPRLREWAFAGFFFDLSGAAYLHIAAGDYAGAPASLVLVALLVAAYVLRRNQNSTAADPSLAPA